MEKVLFSDVANFKYREKKAVRDMHTHYKRFSVVEFSRLAFNVARLFIWTAFFVRLRPTRGMCTTTETMVATALTSKRKIIRANFGLFVPPVVLHLSAKVCDKPSVPLFFNNLMALVCC